MSEKYNKTLLACYLGFITQAITANFTPLLFLMFNKNYEVSLGKIALIPAVFFLTQLVVYAIGSGLIEVLGSPIVEACPFDHKEAVMILLIPVITKKNS